MDGDRAFGAMVAVEAHEVRVDGVASAEQDAELRLVARQQRIAGAGGRRAVRAQAAHLEPGPRDAIGIGEEAHPKGNFLE